MAANANITDASLRTTGKVRAHQTQNEALMFEKSSPGKRAYKMPPLDVPTVDSAALLGAAVRTDEPELPELIRECGEVPHDARGELLEQREELVAHADT